MIIPTCLACVVIAYVYAQLHARKLDRSPRPERVRSGNGKRI